MKKVALLVFSAFFAFPGMNDVFMSSAATNPPPVVTNIALWSGTNLEIGAHGRLGKRFRLDTCDTLDDWSAWETVTPSSSNFSLQVPLQTNTLTGFSRLMMLPGTNPPVWSWTLNYPLAFSPSDVTNLFLQWRPPSDPLDITGYRIYQDDLLIAEPAATTFTYEVQGLTTGRLYRFRIEAGNEDNNWTSNGLALSIRPAPGDPTAMASVPGNGIPTSAGDSIRFLFDATNAVQTGADTNALQSYRLSILHGRVLDAQSNALEGVAVRVQGEPDYGITLTRSNGCYDLAVNGGAFLVLDFRRYDYLPVQRTIDVPWQEGLEIDDVFLLQPVTNKAVVNLTNSAAMQVARGAEVSDADGTRSAMVLVPTNAGASIITYAGETQEVDRLTTRFTEYTAGSIGPEAMPGDLPPSVAYTYCVELGSDEAQDKVAGKDVLFDTNVYFYTDNFLGIPAGIGVPMGYYDNDRGAWVPSTDGIVIRLLGTNEAGLARICANTNGTESDAGELAALGFTDDERLTLAQTYSPATNSLWRVPIRHFSTYDCNYGVVPEAGAEAPVQPPVSGGETVPHPNVNCGNSGIEVENQVLTESLPLPGTPYHLVYSSRTAAQNPKFRKARIPVSGASIPTNIIGMRLKLSVAGKNYSYDLPAQTNQSLDFTWDGLDVYGRAVKGAQPLSYSIEYIYPGFYALPPRMNASFGTASGEPIPAMIRAREQATLSQDIRSTIGTFDAASRGLGGWLLNVHHVYDPQHRILYLGTGHMRKEIQIMTRSSETEWITDVMPGTGGSALNAPLALAVAPDGSLYVADSVNQRIARVDRYGNVLTVATLPSYTKDLAVAPDGSIYVTAGSVPLGTRIYRVTKSGEVETWNEQGGMGPRTPGVPVSQLYLDCAGMAVASDGTLFLADLASNLVWRVGPDGIAHIAAGKLAAFGGYDGNGLPARDSRLLYPNGLAYHRDGQVYICDEGNNRLRSLTPGGFLRDIAGDGSSTSDGDGGEALSAGLRDADDVAIGIDGSLFVLQRMPTRSRLRQILPNGRILTIAGEGDEQPGNGRLASQVALSSDCHIACGLDGSIYVSDGINDRIYRFRPATRPLEQEYTLVVASQDASQLYVFDTNGRHLRTLDALTGVTNVSFTYTADGFLESATDGNGRTTQMHRDGGGLITSIESPGGQSISFTLDGDNLIDTATYPDTGQYQVAYTNTMLSAFTRPRGYTSTYAYDDDGNLVRYIRSDGGTGTLDRIEISGGWTVVHTNPIGVVQTFETELTDVGGQWTRVHYACGCGPDYDKYTTPDGLSSNVNSEGNIALRQTGADPRFGMQAPYTAWSLLCTPFGLQRSVTNRLTAGIPDSDMPQDFTVMTNISVINGRRYVSTFDRSTRQQTDTSPMNRVSISRLDTRGRTKYTQHSGLAGVTLGYDGRGYLASITEGSGVAARVTSLTVNDHGRITAITNAESVVTRMTYDACNRLTNWSHASVVHVAFAHDLEGNRILTRSPKGDAHTYTYTPENLLERYAAPAVGGVSNVTQWLYNSAGLTEFIHHPDGAAEEYRYDEAGRVQWYGYGDEGDFYSYGSVFGGSLLTRVESSNGVVLEYTYDGTLLMDEIWSGAVTGIVSRAWDDNLWITGMAINGSITIPCRYDADGLLTNIGPMQITRDAHNGLVTATELGRVADSYAYNAFGELTNYCVTVDGSNLYHAALERDRLGRITRRVSTDSNGTRTNVYTYDVAGRYIEAITNGVTMRWAFDLNGNLTNVSRGGTAIASARYDAEDRLEQWNTDTYGYTARGTLSTAVLDGVVHCYDYDVRGVLRGVTRDAGAVTGITYTADGMGRRMARFVNGTQTHAFLYYDDIHPAAVLNSSNGIEAVLAYPPNGGTPVYMTVTGRTFRIVTDHLGSPLFVVDSVTGEITQRMTYNTWGAVQSDSQPLLQPIGFGGGLYDPETGWVRFGARDYDPAVGRWTTKDPNLFADRIPNLYRYCRNDPVNMVDSRGAVPTPRIKDPSQHYEPDPRGPHGIKGPSVTGEATILVNRRPAARVSDTGIHTPLAGPELWKAAGGAENVLIEIMYPMEIETERAASAIAAEAAVSGYTVGFVGDNQPVCIPHEGTPVSP